ncbi:MAG: 4-(cytidine 5'-diphospho)-2-C-methyl-D-erythritol kinase [Lachnospiraceae bacterium]|nr:4-(cytidine 5'-diphospho)-2-C-methyl-D-erythritol kinase [Lachnospiraceae bacterium]
MTNTKITLKAHAKINLTLDVTGIRPNGYHDVEMVMQSIGLFDELTAERTSGNELSLNCRFSDNLGGLTLPTGPKNLVWKAALKFFDACKEDGPLKRELPKDTGVDFTLIKNIPAEAGMGGGSTDAAAALRALNILFETDFSTEELCSIGAKVGADVPFCVLGGTALAEGIGEILTPLPAAPNTHLLLVKPPVGASTKEIYDGLMLDKNTVHPDTQGMIKALENKDYALMCRKLSNVLEPVTIGLLPVIGEIKEKILALGADAALMSGSGSTVFGLFECKEKALAALEHFKSSKELYCTLTNFYEK